MPLRHDFKQLRRCLAALHILAVGADEALPQPIACPYVHEQPRHGISLLQQCIPHMNSRVIDSSMFGPAQDVDFASIGMQFLAAGVTVASIPAGEIELHHTSASDLMEVHIEGPPVRYGLDSDKIKTTGELLPGAISFLPRGSSLRLQALNTKPNLIFVLDRNRLLQIAHESGFIDEAALCTVIWEHDAVALDIARHILGELEKARDANRLFVESLSIALAARILGHQRKTHGLSIPVVGLDARIRRAIEYANANLDEKLEVADMAAAAHLSPFHFLRVFKAVTGETPHAYVTRRRIEYAEGLLRHSPLLLAEIALACGFSSQPHFTSAFMRARGTSPGKFRRSN
jgi:AraC-like DNA-binding protein